MELKKVKGQSCVACLAELAAFGVRERFAYHRCVRCGSLQLVPLPTPGELAEAYRTQYASAGHCRSRSEDALGAGQPYFDAIAGALEAHHVDGPVLEVGSGWGGLAETLIRRGVAYEGIDLSEEMVAACQSRGLPIRYCDLADAEAKPHAAVVLSAVFEHLVEHDAWLAHARNQLAPGGLFVSMQPTAHFAAFAGGLLRNPFTKELPQLHQVFCPPWHTVLFSIEGMKTLMARNGFEFVEVRRGPQAKGPGMTGVLQRVVEAVNRAGWAMAGASWPLVISHIFVFRRVG